MGSIIHLGHEGPPPPPAFTSKRERPTTVTMRAICEADDERPSASFDELLDDALTAYLSRDYPMALALYRDALRLDPANALCRTNIQAIEQRIACSA